MIFIKRQKKAKLWFQARAQGRWDVSLMALKPCHVCQSDCPFFPPSTSGVFQLMLINQRAILLQCGSMVYYSVRFLTKKLHKCECKSKKIKENDCKIMVRVWKTFKDYKCGEGKLKIDVESNNKDKLLVRIDTLRGNIILLKILFNKASVVLR